MKAADAAAASPVRVSVDVLGESSVADCVEGAVRAIASDPRLAITLVGPVDALADLLARSAPSPDIEVASAHCPLDPDEDAVRAVRAVRRLGVRVVAERLASGAADAAVCTGSSRAALAAAQFAVPRLAGVTGCVLAAVHPAPGGPVVVLDVSGDPGADPALLAQWAQAGASLAQARGMRTPRVALLTGGPADIAGRTTATALADLLGDGVPAFAGTCTGEQVAAGPGVDVVLTDGRTGHALMGALQVAASGRSETGVVLGVQGVMVVSGCPANASSVAAAIGVAATLHRGHLVDRGRAALAGLVARRRVAAGLAAVAP